MKCNRLKGLPVSQGISIGPVFVYSKEEMHRLTGTITAGAVEGHLQLLAQGEQRAREELEAGIARFREAEPEKADILSAHLEILNDPCVMESIQQKVREELLCWEQAVWDAYQEVLAMFAELEDPMFQGRAADLKDVRDRLLRCCAGKPEPDLSLIDRPVILVAKDLAPSDTACLPKALVLGIATELGGATSHTAILARAGGIPAVLGVEGLLTAVQNGQMAVVDALNGTIYPEPDEELLADYERRRTDWLSVQAEDEAFLEKPAATADGTPILTEVNLGGIGDAYTKAAVCADGVGLLRTEFLYMGAKTLPDEEYQHQAYAQVLQAFGDRPVILRTLDIGGDKQLPYLALPKEENPFLGLRALRFCLANEPLFRTQLRAAYRASVRGNLWIMFPMVGSIEDFRLAKRICMDVCRELEEEGIPFRRDVKLGIMIEVPSIALTADLAAKETDFASIGTNDLCQYVCAADRMNSEVGAYYRTRDPGLLRLIRHVAEAYAAEGKPVGVCGELAADPEMAQVLVGLGIRTLSMNGAALGRVRRAIAEKTLAEMQAQALQLL